MAGSEAKAVDFLNWFCDLPHRQYSSAAITTSVFSVQISMGLDSNVHYLCNSGVEIDGVKFYGVPLFMADCISERQNENYATVPTDTDVLVTHTPPYGILDFDDNIHYGSEELLQRVAEVSLRLHLFGHIHRQHGTTDNGITRFSNGAIMNTDYTDLHTPNLIEL